MVTVPDRSAATMLPIIQQYVLSGTVQRLQQAYNQLPNHNIVNHRFNFVDPDDPSVRTNTVEGSWGLCKAKFRSMHGTSDSLFDSHIQEFPWRRLFVDKAFGNILFWIAHYYLQK
jgi:hypothetical protein